jgi:type II secretory pathway pseudopilin PulG
MNKRGQVWIETVLYTLIGLTLLGLALGFIMPKINESRDKVLVEQAINSLSSFDEKISEAVQRGSGNIRQAEFSMKKGELYIDGVNDRIRFVIDGLTKPYSQPGVEIAVGRVRVVSSLGQKTSSVNLTVQYVANLTYDGKDELPPKKFTAAALPYKFFIENKGVTGAEPKKTWVDINEISNR